MREEKSNQQADITVIVCAFNEELNLPYVLPKIPKEIGEIMLVDGHSTDKTVEIAGKLRPDIRILVQPGRGKADALVYGVEQATGSIIVTIDADGETNPDEIFNFIEPLRNGYDFAKGSRLVGHRLDRMPWFRWFGNKILAITCNLLYGTKFTDVCSGYNAFRKQDFLNFKLTYNIGEVGCSMEQQMICRAIKAGLRIIEVPHKSAGRIAGASRISGVKRATKQGFTDLLVIIRERFRE